MRAESSAFPDVCLRCTIPQPGQTHRLELPEVLHARHPTSASTSRTSSSSSRAATKAHRAAASTSSVPTIRTTCAARTGMEPSSMSTHRSRQSSGTRLFARHWPTAMAGVSSSAHRKARTSSTRSTRKRGASRTGTAVCTAPMSLVSFHRAADWGRKNLRP